MTDTMKALKINTALQTILFFKHLHNTLLGQTDEEQESLSGIFIQVANLL